jgi:hypothetical protein
MMMTKPITDIFPGSNPRKKQNWQSREDKQYLSITHNDL